jgi:hypothetical protein
MYWIWYLAESRALREEEALENRLIAATEHIRLSKSVESHNRFAEFYEKYSKVQEAYGWYACEVNSTTPSTEAPNYWIVD